MNKQTPGITRRRFIATGATIAAGLGAACVTSTASRIVESSYPFTLGVASGDPEPDSVVLWTRLAPRPRDPDGGMPPVPVSVQWQVSEDEQMSRIVRKGSAAAVPDWAHSIHVEVRGLQPDRWYWYRFITSRHTSAVGRTRTLPAHASETARFRFAFASCQKYEMGFYTAYEHMTRESVDLVFHLGDYIYERADGKGAVRPHGTPEAYTLSDYRQRYGLYKSDPALQAAHAAAPWIVTWDDHELNNNYAGWIPERPDRTSSEQFRERRIAAYRAYYEHMPLRRMSLPKGPDLRMYRSFRYGKLASFHVLDTRQYRSDQLQGDGARAPTAALMDPARTVLGAEQREWLFRGLVESQTTWNVIAQQIMMAPVDRKPGPQVLVSMDTWTGYEFERLRFLRHLQEKRVRNPVVLTGDIHSNWANELTIETAAGKTEPVGVEWVGTSISSDGDGEDQPPYHSELLAENPCVKFHNRERGYVVCDVTAGRWRTDFKTVSYVTRPGAPLLTRASFEVDEGSAVLRRLS